MVSLALFCVPCQSNDVDVKQSPEQRRGSGLVVCIQVGRSLLDAPVWVSEPISERTSSASAAGDASPVRQLPDATKEAKSTTAPVQSYNPVGPGRVMWAGYRIGQKPCGLPGAADASC